MISEITRKVGNDLGLNGELLEAHIYKLLIYEKDYRAAAQALGRYLELQPGDSGVTKLKGAATTDGGAA